MVSRDVADAEQADDRIRSQTLRIPEAEGQAEWPVTRRDRQRARREALLNRVSVLTAAPCPCDEAGRGEIRTGDISRPEPNARRNRDSARQVLMTDDGESAQPTEDEV